LPFWWPAESKARVDPSSASAGVEDAFRQLAAYWYSIHDSLLWRDDVGFGIVFSFVYERSPGVHVHFFLPRDANGLRDLLRSFPDYDAYAEHLEEDPNRHKETHPCLHLDA